MTKIPEWLRMYIWRALLGAIYPSIRAIVVSYDNKNLTLRYYMDRDPVSDDFENMEIVATEIDAGSYAGEFNSIKLECLYSDLPIGKIDFLDGFIYARKED